VPPDGERKTWLTSHGIVSATANGNARPAEAGIKKLQHADAQAAMRTRSQFALSHGAAAGGQQSGMS
jgi:hypothetical protein